MAIWQYNFFILPRESVVDDSSSFQFEDDESFDDSKFWGTCPTKCNFFAAVEKILPIGKSWHEELLVYGDLKSNCFTVFCTNNFVASTTLRIDFTTNYEPVLSSVLEFLILNGLVVLDEALNVLPLNFEAVKNVIENSPQVKKYKNLSNP